MEPNEISPNTVVDERRERMLTNLLRREEERRTTEQVNKEERKQITSTDAGRKNFDVQYPEMKNTLEKMLEKICLSNEKNNDQSTTTNETQKEFQDIADKIQKMEKFINEHVDILRVRDVANAQSDVVKYREQLNSLRDRTLTNKKFDFTTNRPSADSPLSSPKENGTTKFLNGGLKTLDTVDPSADSSKTTTITSVNTVNISNKHGEFLRYENDDLNGKDVAIENLDECEIFLKGSPSSLQIKNLKSCILIVGPCSRSILIEQCKQCEFAFACQQLRIHTTQECDFYVHITAKAIIENCSSCRFAPYNVYYENKQSDVKKSGLIWDRDYWNDVVDFNWLTPGIQSPNWETIIEDERKEWSLDATS
ncbi:unnamed protein product [Didymodactylos carnosus]|uniref:C-CAP/cofactor C-like domain-containing protein n=1 Tax=Didymodactylos carnosus TaxID=1234261 RepID=A0A813P6T6_9BILA|nr:unnamed protein product [Didymodactylos carnosus]CAF0748270.1 unnamed protein product [Didymodactylos carnosus]CAF3506884.1 unnamed protein product [Didymodactylos carnosus]CAF3527395.1 unnamed protein product [Didymodactylos carnosus]